MNEFANVCRRKLKLDCQEIEERLAVVKALVSEVAPVSVETHEKAVEIARDNSFSFYDTLIIAAALALECAQLLTEDMQDGQQLEGLTIKSPF